VCLAIKRHPTAAFGYYVQPEFFIYQHRCRRALLELAQEYFGTGRIRPKPGNPDVLVYSIISRPMIVERVLPFSEAFMRFSARTHDFERFAIAVEPRSRRSEVPARLGRNRGHCLCNEHGWQAAAETARADNRQNPQRPYARRPWPGRRDGPISTATWRARRNRNDLALRPQGWGVTEMPKVAKFLVG
jgi:hypothetical protein